MFSYVIIEQNGLILTHERRPYAESRSRFSHKRALGFSVPVCQDDLTLFDQEDHGIVSAGLTAVAIDLDLEFSADFPAFERSAKLHSLIALPDSDYGFAILGLVLVEAPRDFDPSGRRLSVGNLVWSAMASQHNNWDPWSKFLTRYCVDRDISF